jgi:hypothetical protein
MEGYAEVCWVNVEFPTHGVQVERMQFLVVGNGRKSRADPPTRRQHAIKVGAIELYDRDIHQAWHVREVLQATPILFDGAINEFS